MESPTVPLDLSCLNSRTTFFRLAWTVIILWRASMIHEYNVLEYQFVVLVGEDGRICQVLVAIEKSPLLVWWKQSANWRTSTLLSSALFFSPWLGHARWRCSFRNANLRYTVFDWGFRFQLALLSSAWPIWHTKRLSSAAVSYDSLARSVSKRLRAFQRTEYINWKWHILCNIVKHWYYPSLPLNPGILHGSSRILSGLYLTNRAACSHSSPCSQPFIKAPWSSLDLVISKLCTHTVCRCKHTDSSSRRHRLHCSYFSLSPLRILVCIFNILFSEFPAIILLAHRVGRVHESAIFWRIDQWTYSTKSQTQLKAWKTSDVVSWPRKHCCKWGFIIYNHHPSLSH